MKQILVVLFAFVITPAAAQVTARATITATVVHPVGTEEIVEEKSQSVSLTNNKNDLAFLNFASFPAKLIDVAKFKVVNSTSLYSISIQQNTPNTPFFNTAYVQPNSIKIQSITNAVKQDAFALNASINTTPFDKSQPHIESFDITVHFN